ncbi:MAG: hypothetical protein ABR607_03595 [Pyrinomonadaceae bacterium]
MAAFGETQRSNERTGKNSSLPRIIQRFAGNKFARELFIFAAFIMFTTVMTWPWITRLHDACADPGDPYLVSWILWWDFHQTFTSPLHLFDANIFYPLHQTLAFSENDYGISLLFFPLFALGFRPLTVNSIATFVAFAFSGYGAFRLTRTLTGSNGSAWIAGLVFAFVPYRFHLLSQLHYVFTGWMPLTLEAFVLFARARSYKRAAWLAAAFTMNALSCLSWFTLSLAPLALSLVYLSIRYELLRDRKFWKYGSLAAAVSLLALLPFMLPYLRVSRAFGFAWGPEVIARNSPSAARWLVAEYRNRMWKGFGDNLAGNGPKLFTGLLSPLLALAAVLLPGAARESAAVNNAYVEFRERKRSQWVLLIDALAFASAIMAVLSIGWRGATNHPWLAKFFAGDTLARSLFVFAGAIFFRLVVAYPQVLRRITGAKNLIAQFRKSRPREAWWRSVLWNTAGAVIWFTIITVTVVIFSNWSSFSAFSMPGNYFSGKTLDLTLLVLAVAVVLRFSLNYPKLLIHATGAKNLIEHIRDRRRSDAVWLGIIWIVTGFLMSLGTNAWFYRILYEIVFLFRSMREPSRAAMVADLGMAVLAGVGAMKLIERIAGRRKQLRPALALALIIIALLFELRVAPLTFTRGAAEPDEVTLRLKQTPMRGGLVELPTGNGILPHLYMLRSADHAKPLINAISTFVPPHAWEIEGMSKATPISLKLLDALERVPTSYVVIHNSLIEPERHSVYEAFLAAAVATDRLRFINRFDNGNDIYAVVKTEPEAKSEATLPFSLSIHELSALVREDPVNIVAASPSKFQTLYRIYLETNAAMPRHDEFMKDAERIARGVILESEDRDQIFDDNLRKFAEGWTRTNSFINSFGQLTDTQFVDKLLANAGVVMDQSQRATLIDDLMNHRETRAGTLLKVANDQRFVQKENDRSLLLLHYFGYLRRNPDDPPDRDLRPFEFWLRQLSEDHNGRISVAFQDSIEYHEIKQRHQ